MLPDAHVYYSTNITYLRLISPLNNLRVLGLCKHILYAFIQNPHQIRKRKCHSKDNNDIKEVILYGCLGHRSLDDYIGTEDLYEQAVDEVKLQGNRSQEAVHRIADSDLEAYRHGKKSYGQRRYKLTEDLPVGYLNLVHLKVIVLNNSPHIVADLITEIGNYNKENQPQNIELFKKPYKALLELGYQYSHKEHMGGVIPPCAASCAHTPIGPCNASQSYDKDSEPILLDESESETRNGLDNIRDKKPDIRSE